MSASPPKNLETDFDSLCIITSKSKPKLRPRSLGNNVNKYSKCVNSRRRQSFILSPRICGCEKDNWAGKTVLRPAKLRLTSISKKSTLIRPARLKFKESKVFFLKPATLIVDDKHKSSIKSSKFGVPCLSKPSVAFSVGRVFSSDKLGSQSSFKSLVADEDTKISKAFDALSFKKLRHKKSPSSEGLIANKRDNTSSCSVQARMESSVPVDCDDTSIEELASYFDLFVHIPKKMSSMAEMMYI